MGEFSEPEEHLVMFASPNALPLRVELIMSCLWSSKIEMRRGRVLLWSFVCVSMDVGRFGMHRGLFVVGWSKNDAPIIHNPVSLLCEAHYLWSSPNTFSSHRGLGLIASTVYSYSRWATAFQTAQPRSTKRIHKAFILFGLFGFCNWYPQHRAFRPRKSVKSSFLCEHNHQAKRCRSIVQV